MLHHISNVTSYHGGTKRKLRAPDWLQSAVTKTHPIYAAHFYVAQVVVFTVECGITHFLCTMCVFDVRASSSPQATFVPNFVPLRPLLLT